MVGLIFLAGCNTPPTKERVIKQPIQFNHSKHVQYFLTGNHKDEFIKWHLEALDENEAPTELAEGKCLECHDSFDDTPDCRGCHLIFQDEKVRDNLTQRPCLGCHRTAWTGYLAGIPTIQVCKSCHSKEQRTTSEHEMKLREFIDRNEDIPWIQTNSMVDHVHFSHIAHIRFAGITCKHCHPQKMGVILEPSGKTLKFSMNFCIECHEEYNAPNDCLVCHK